MRESRRASRLIAAPPATGSTKLRHQWTWRAAVGTAGFLAAAAPVWITAAGAGSGVRTGCWQEMGTRGLSYTLHPDAEAQAGGALRLRVRAAVPAGQNLVVARGDGEILGVVAPFGPAPEGGVTTALMSAPEISGDRPVELRFWLESHAGDCQVPDREVLRSVELVPVEADD